MGRYCKAVQFLELAEFLFHHLLGKEKGSFRISQYDVFYHVWF